MVPPSQYGPPLLAVGVAGFEVQKHAENSEVSPSTSVAVAVIMSPGSIAIDPDSKPVPLPEITTEPMKISPSPFPEGSQPEGFLKNSIVYGPSSQLFKSKCTTPDPDD